MRGKRNMRVQDINTVDFENYTLSGNNNYFGQGRMDNGPPECRTTRVRQVVSYLSRTGVLVRERRAVQTVCRPDWTTNLDCEIGPNTDDNGTYGYTLGDCILSADIEKMYFGTKGMGDRSSVERLFGSG